MRAKTAILIVFWVSSVAFSGQMFSKYNTFGDVEQEFYNLYSVVQPKAHRVVTSIPHPSELRDGEFVLANVSNTLMLYTLVQGSTYSVTLQR